MNVSKSGTAILGLSLLLLAAWGCGGGDHAPSMPVLLITVDGLAADQLSLFDGPKATPALLKLADGAVIYKDAWTASPMTRAAVATYLTGIAPDRHGMRDDIYAALPEGVPTLAALLSEMGYRTAAFPNSSFLGYSSGLLRGFDLVDEPAELPVGPDKMIPLARAASHGAENFKLWLEDMPPATEYFAWLHFSGPLLDQLAEFIPRGSSGSAMKGKAKGKRKARSDEPQNEEKLGAKRARKGAPPDDGSAVEAFDAALKTILDVVETRGELKSALIIVVATYADISGGRTDAVGAGFSLDERAINVPLVVRFPAGSAPPRAKKEIVWAPDIAATIAELAGVALADGAEGLSLLRNPAEERVIYSWSWATLDQMGWRPLRAARQGNIKLLQGVEDELITLDGEELAEGDEVGLRLLDKLSGRTELAPPVVDLSLVRPWLEARGIALDPLPIEGRNFLSDEKRRTASSFLWKARLTPAIGFRTMGAINYATALGADPDGLGPLFELGQCHALALSAEAEREMAKAAVKYPYNSEVLHWYAHAIWQEHWAETEELIDTLLTYRPQDTDLLYDKACARSLAGDTAGSLEFLETAIQAGFERWNLIQRDSDLRHLRESPEFSELLRNYGR